MEILVNVAASSSLYETPFVLSDLRSYLFSLLHSTFETCNKITTEMTDCDLSAPFKEKSELPNFVEQTRKSRLVTHTSEAKRSCAKTLVALDLLETFLRWPSVETATALKLVFERGKNTSKESLTAEDADKTLEMIHVILEKIRSEEAGNEPMKAPNCDQTTENRENMNSESNFYSKECTISRKGSSFDHEEEKVFSLFPNLENMSDEGCEKSGKKHEIGLSRDDLESKRKSYLQTLQKRMEEMQEENNYLKEHLELLRIEYRETLAELGRMMVERTAQENIKRNSEKSLGISLCSKVSRKNYCLNVFHDPKEITAESAGSNEQAVQGAEALVETTHYKEGNGNEEMLTNVKDERKLREEESQSLCKASKDLEKERKSGGMGKNISGEEMKEKTPSSLVSSCAEESENEGSLRQTYEYLSFSVQQDSPNDRDYVSVSNQPPTSESVATTLYYNYKLLLLTLAERLLSSEAEQLRNWASQNFSIDTSQKVTDVFFQLDRKQIINASDLSRLENFFESILRIDLVYIIDSFLLGDYDVVRMHQRKLEVNTSREKRLGERARSSHTTPLNGASSHSTTLQNDAQGNPQRRTQNNDEVQNPFPHLPRKTPFPSFLENQHTTNRKHIPTYQDEHPLNTKYGHQNLTRNLGGLTDTTLAEVAVADGPITRESRLKSSNSSTSVNPPVNQRRNTQTLGSNGFKLSKPRQPDTAQSISRSPRNQAPDDEVQVQGNWLCSHYKRRCFVKFDCCDKFWPCHRCHNNQSTCGRKKLKSRDTKKLKCANCNKVQEFGQYCRDCNAKFAMYYCGLCKHLTGTDDHPYHCDKCGICRIHGDRSFHCDICGVCLDVQLRGNHKCREGSAHDECCICLEDAFTGCQILPCSHKVHKECATQMIRSGIRRCPICRESFAHKLERRPMSDKRKHSGQ